jgi:hypothetical protein
MLDEFNERIRPLLEQQDLFDITRVSIDAAEDHADPQWYRSAFVTVKSLGLLGAEFTTDDVWAYLVSTTHEPRAMGAVMRQAVRDGFIESTGRYIKSKRPECHMRPILVYRGRP